MSKLEELRNSLAALVEQTKDPDFNKDARENSARDDILREIYSLQSTIRALERTESETEANVPAGAIGLGTNFRATYLDIFNGSRRKSDAEMPPPFVATLVAGVDFPESPYEKSPDTPLNIAVTSPIGRTIYGKIPGIFQIPTNVGHIALEVEFS